MRKFLECADPPSPWTGYDATLGFFPSRDSAAGQRVGGARPLLEFPTMPALIVDAKKRIRLPDAEPNQVFACERQGEHPVVLISHPDRCARGALVNVLYCTRRPFLSVGPVPGKANVSSSTPRVVS